MEAAYSAAQYLSPDPAYWLDQAGLAGLRVATDGERLGFHAPDGETDEVQFLKIWLAISGGDDAVIALLLKRQIGREAAHV